jgi:hypothetical protein
MFSSPVFASKKLIIAKVVTVTTHDLEDEKPVTKQTCIYDMVHKKESV